MNKFKNILNQKNISKKNLHKIIFREVVATTDAEW